MEIPSTLPTTLPVLPIRNAVLFPTVSMPLVVGRSRSLQALQAAESAGNLIVVVTQKNLTAGEPTADDLYRVGTICKIESASISEAGSRQVIVTGVARYRIEKYLPPAPGSSEDGSPSAPFLQAQGEIVSDILSPDTVRMQALLNNLKTLSREVLEFLPGGTEPLIRLIDRLEDASYLTNICAAYLNLTLFQKQELLETIEVDKRIESLLVTMKKEREVLSLQHEIRDKMSERLNKAQRDALLREQLRTIRSELGEEESTESSDDLQEKVRAANLPDEALKQAEEELKRLRSLPSASAEYHVVRTYLEWLSSMPWRVTTSDILDLERARAVLDEDHFGLEHVKRRILQFLAVAKLKKDLHGPILCLVGPPGVGKTSLGHSIARTLGRKFIRTSMGGVRDEAEIRGHRRTYVGAMPGRIIQTIKRAGTRNPLMMLDEIDKLRADFLGDPSAAMLEVLDPEQNKSFTDHYLDVPFDLSDVFFICTANIVDTIPPPLRDRMEIIEVNGYTTYEKLHIAKNYLLPKQLIAHGLTPDQVNLPDDSILKLISHYTREAGVRELERKIAALLRGAAEDLVKAIPVATLPISLTSERVKSLLGPERYYSEIAERKMKPGVATGLAWTPHGGDLIFLEAKRMPGKGTLILTGQLGDVMKESAQIALSLARATPPLSPHPFEFGHQDIHIHVPAGAIPKDGPSAGITIFVAIMSLLLDKAVDPTLGMTGEITLRGAILPVGGIKEKVLAAHRAELKTLILPKRNEADLEEVPDEVRKGLHFIFADTIEDVLETVFGIKEARTREAPPPTDIQVAA